MDEPAKKSNDDAGAVSDLDIRTPWEEVMEMFRRASLKKEENEAEEEYVSCIKINDRPILPPLMTPEKRGECRRWREKAVEVENRLRLLHGQEDGDEYEEDGEESESEPVVFSRSASSIAGGPVVADVVMTTPFKSLIHRLRQDVKGVEVAAGSTAVSGTSQYDSTMSVNTVVENPCFSPKRIITPPSKGGLAKDALDPPSTPFRSRSGSYTLTEPSPMLKAYIDKYGGEATPASEGIVPHSRSVSALSSLLSNTPLTGENLPMSGELKTEAEKVANLDSYLDSLAKMPLGLNATSVAKENQPGSLENDMATQDKEGARSEREIELRQGAITTDTVTNLDDFSIASSAINSVSIVLPSARIQPVPTPQQENITQVQAQEPLSLSAMPPSITPATLTETTHPTATATSSVDVTSRQIEVAVSTLARNQQAQIQLLLQEQERQREELRQAFEEQQKMLISQIVVGVETEKAGKSDIEPSEALSSLDPSKSTGDLPDWAKRGESSATLTVEPTETPVDSAREAAGSVSPVVPAVAAHIRPVSTLPEGYTFPAEALAPEMFPLFSRLSAMARGYLTRRLLSTLKVEGIISSIRDTMNTALLLHREATATKEDVELHRRLLLQLNKDYAQLHQIFVESSPAERVALIALDRDTRARHEAEKENEPGERRRLSAATRARLEHKEKMANMGDSADDSSPTRRRRGKSQGRGVYHPANIQSKSQTKRNYRLLQ